MLPARNPYERRRDERRGREAMVGWADGGFLPGFGGPQRSTVEFEDLEAMVGQAAARGRREASLQAQERERVARREAWAEGHAVGTSDGRMEVRAAFEERFGGEIVAAVKATHELLVSVERDARRVSKSELAERCSRLASLLADVSMASAKREA